MGHHRVCPFLWRSTNSGAQVSKPAGGGASPSATSISIARGPRDFGDRATNADRSGSTPLTGANSYPCRRIFRRPSEGRLRVFDSLRGCHFAVEAHRDVRRIGNAQAAGANPAIGTTSALQALRAERRIRNPEVDRAIRSWGTSHGSLTQRDRDPPFKRSDPGAIPASALSLAGDKQPCPFPTVQCVTVAIPARTVYSPGGGSGGLCAAKHRKPAPRCSDEVPAL